jgi:hypothetical protein
MDEGPTLGRANGSRPERVLSIESRFAMYTHSSISAAVARAISRAPEGAGGEIRQLIQDELGATSDVWHDDALVETVQRTWLVEAHQQGCIFASNIGATETGGSWRTKTYRGDIVRAATSFIDDVATAAAAQGVELFSGVFPTVIDAQSLVQLLRELSSHERVEVDAALAWGTKTTVSLSYALNDDVVAWVMCFSGASCVPATRRSPFTEIVVRTKPERQHNYRDAGATCPSAVYVADTPTSLAEHDWASAWRQSERAVARWIGEKDAHYAAARVSCVVPTASWFPRGYELDHLKELAAAVTSFDVSTPTLPTVEWAASPHWLTEISGKDDSVTA